MKIEIIDEISQPNWNEMQKRFFDKYSPESISLFGGMSPVKIGNVCGRKNWLMETIKDYQDRQKKQFRQKVIGEIKFINGSSVVFKPLKDFIDLNPPNFISGRIPNLKVRKRRNESASI